MIVVLTGAPGAGKGTQADLLVERARFRKLSTGDALRKHIKNGTEIGKQAESIIASGKLVSDEILLGIIKAELSDACGENVLLDGYPRNVAQAKTLDQLGTSGVLPPVAAAIHLDVARDELLSRLSGRRVCKNCGKTYHASLNPPKSAGVCDKCGSEVVQRVDDQPDKVSVRLKVYEDETAPILDYYRDKGVYAKVEGTGSTEQVFKDITGILERVEAKDNLN